jgi:integrase
VLHDYAADRGRGARHVFPTRNATPNTPANVRTRVIDGVAKRANALLVDTGVAKIVHLTPHTLRRTFASILAELGVPPRRAMYLLGHTNPRLTMTVYQQVLDVGEGAIELLESILGTSSDDLLRMLSGRSARASLATDWPPGGENPRVTASVG